MPVVRMYPFGDLTVKAPAAVTDLPAAPSVPAPLISIVSPFAALATAGQVVESLRSQRNAEAIRKL
jgi:hypothetical protein